MKQHIRLIALLVLLLGIAAGTAAAGFGQPDYTLKLDFHNASVDAVVLPKASMSTCSTSSIETAEPLTVSYQRRSEKWLETSGKGYPMLARHQING